MNTKSVFFSVLLCFSIGYIFIFEELPQNIELFPITHNAEQSIDFKTMEFNNIDSTISNWKQIFHCIVFHNYNIPHCSDNIPLHLLLINTTNYFNSANFSMPLFINSTTQTYQYSYHDFISLRRQIMIVMNQLNFTKQPLYLYLMTRFHKLHEEYIIYRKALRYKWFHLHFSKAGGTTVHSTIAREFIYPPSNRLPYFWNTRDPLCVQQYRKFKRRAIHREAPLFTHNEYYDDNNIENPYHGASLCNAFMYILPIREPMERICSHASQIQKAPMFNLEAILRTYESYIKLHPDYVNGTHPNERLSNCYGQNVTVNGRVYKLLLEGIDFQNMYVELLQSELDEEYMKLPPVHSEQDVENRILNTSIRGYNLSALENTECFKKKPHGHRFTPVRYGAVEKSEFIFLTVKSLIDIAWHRTVSASNIYTTWMGYNYSKEEANNFAMYPLYVARNKINETHLMNAVDLMMKMDYVLPFRSWTNDTTQKISKQHFMWQYTLEDLHDFFNGTLTQNNRTNISWSEANTSGNWGRISSHDICDNLSEKDKQILMKYNKLDYEFYAISHFIEAADTEFYTMFAK